MTREVNSRPSILQFWFDEALADDLKELVFSDVGVHTA